VWTLIAMKTSNMILLNFLWQFWSLALVPKYVRFTTGWRKVCQLVYFGWPLGYFVVGMLHEVYQMFLVLLPTLALLYTTFKRNRYLFIWTGNPLEPVTIHGSCHVKARCRKAPNVKDRQCISITTHANLQTKVFWNAIWTIPFAADP
jgi:hypothetical protein